MMSPRELFEQELTDAELSAKQDALCEVEQALQRISDGSYGVGEYHAAPGIRLQMRSGHSAGEWNLRAS
jgi:hypothetical protein